MLEQRFAKRIAKKAKKGFRGYPIATIAFYGPDLKRASKVTVAIVRGEGRPVDEMRAWFSEAGDVRHDDQIIGEVLDFIGKNGALSVVMTDGIIGCPHQEGIDYEGEWCPVCDFWRGRDRWTGKMLLE
jgi:hypothetical protein